MTTRMQNAHDENSVDERKLTSRGSWLSASPYLSLVLEQAIISGVNTIYLITLGRVLSVSEFALVGLGFTIFLFGVAIYESLVSDPMVVLRTGNPADQEGCIALVWRLHLGLITTFGILSFVIWFIDDHLAIRGTALGMAFLSVATSTVFMRRRLHSESNTDLSVRAAMAYAIALAGVTAVLWRAQLLYPQSAPIPFLAGNLAFLALARHKIPRWRHHPKTGSYFSDHVRYARSSVIYAALTNMTTNIYPALFAFLGNEAAIGGYRLLLTTFTPFFQSLGAVSAFAIPKLANSSVHNIERATLAVLALTSMGPLILAVFALPFGQATAVLLFGEPYRMLGDVAPIAYLGATLSLLVQMIVLWLRANQKLKELRAAGVVSFMTTLVFALPFASHFGLAGAFISWTLANVATLTLLMFATWRFR